MNHTLDRSVFFIFIVAQFSLLACCVVRKLAVASEPTVESPLVSLSKPASERCLVGGGINVSKKKIVLVQAS